MRHVVGTERYDVCRRTAELSGEHELVFLCYLLGRGLRARVEFGESVLCRLVAAQPFLHQLVVEELSERLGSREEHTSLAHGDALNEVEVSVWIGSVVVVEAVGTHQPDKRQVLHLLFGDVAQIDTSGVALVFHVEAELLLLHVGSQIVDVFHHQAPVSLLRIVARVLQRLHEQRLADVGYVGGELSHLVGHAAVGVLVGHGQHLVGLQGGLERHVSQCVVDGVFRRIEQSCALKLLEVAAAHQSLAFEHVGCLVDVAHSGQHFHGVVFAVSLV